MHGGALVRESHIPLSALVPTDMSCAARVLRPITSKREAWSLSGNTRAELGRNKL
jgi:hypothetical protein